MRTRGPAPTVPLALNRQTAGTVRIIGGSLRRRRIRFDAVAGLRPTPDRVRETLFNWLAPVIRGSRCLDLFAGSGALGFEAYSRGAAEVDLVEKDARAFTRLEENRRVLAPGAAGLHLYRNNAWTFLERARAPFDIVFLDPPFDGDAVGRALDRLVDGGLLAPGALVYVERRFSRTSPPTPIGYRELKRARAGDVDYALLCRVDTDGGD